MFERTFVIIDDLFEPVDVGGVPDDACDLDHDHRSTGFQDFKNLTSASMHQGPRGRTP